ncbi:hypothetical protein PCE1_001707 [Barthelona sp. PCE]
MPFFENRWLEFKTHGVCKHDFAARASGQLSLNVGDHVTVLKRCDDWFFGHLREDTSLRGVFPARLLSHSDEHFQAETGEALLHVGEMRTAQDTLLYEHPIIEEIKKVLKEWRTALHSSYNELLEAQTNESSPQICNTLLMRYRSISQHICRLVSLRRRYLSPLANARMRRDIAFDIVNELSQGSKVLGLSLTARNANGDVADVDTCTFPYLYSMYYSLQEESVISQFVIPPSLNSRESINTLDVKNVFSSRNDLRASRRSMFLFPTQASQAITTAPTNKNQVLALSPARSMRTIAEPFDISPEGDAVAVQITITSLDLEGLPIDFSSQSIEICGFLYDVDQKETLTEAFSVPLLTSGLPEPRRLSSFVFTSVPAQKLGTGLQLILRVYKSVPSGPVGNTRWPLGISIFSITEFRDQLSCRHIDTYLGVQDEHSNESFGVLHMQSGKSPKYFSGRGVGVTISCSQKGASEFINEATETGAVCRCLRSSTVDVDRSDVYVTLMSATLPKPPGKKTAANCIGLVQIVPNNEQMYNPQQQMDIFKTSITEDYGILPFTGEKVSSQYCLPVYYHNQSPLWNETIKIVLPSNLDEGFHLRISFFHYSSSRGLSSPFCVVSLPITMSSGLLVSTLGILAWPLNTFNPNGNVDDIPTTQGLLEDAEATIFASESLSADANTLQNAAVDKFALIGGMHVLSSRLTTDPVVHALHRWRSLEDKELATLMTQLKSPEYVVALADTLVPSIDALANASEAFLPDYLMQTLESMFENPTKEVIDSIFPTILSSISKTNEVCFTSIDVIITLLSEIFGDSNFLVDFQIIFNQYLNNTFSNEFPLFWLSAIIYMIRLFNRALVSYSYPFNLMSCFSKLFSLLEKSFLCFRNQLPNLPGVFDSVKLLARNLITHVFVEAFKLINKDDTNIEIFGEFQRKMMHSLSIIVANNLGEIFNNTQRAELGTRLLTAIELGNAKLNIGKVQASSQLLTCCVTPKAQNILIPVIIEFAVGMLSKTDLLSFPVENVMIPQFNVSISLENRNCNLEIIVWMLLLDVLHILCSAVSPGLGTHLPVARDLSFGISNIPLSQDELRELLFLPVNNINVMTARIIDVDGPADGISQLRNQLAAVSILTLLHLTPKAMLSAIVAESCLRSTIANFTDSLLYYTVKFCVQFLKLQPIADNWTVFFVRSIEVVFSTLSLCRELLGEHLLTWYRKTRPEGFQFNDAIHIISPSDEAGEWYEIPGIPFDNVLFVPFSIIECVLLLLRICEITKIDEFLPHFEEQLFNFFVDLWLFLNDSLRIVFAELILPRVLYFVSTRNNRFIPNMVSIIIDIIELEYKLTAKLDRTQYHFLQAAHIYFKSQSFEGIIEDKLLPLCDTNQFLAAGRPVLEASLKLIQTLRSISTQVPSDATFDGLVNGLEELLATLRKVGHRDLYSKYSVKLSELFVSQGYLSEGANVLLRYSDMMDRGNEEKEKIMHRAVELLSMAQRYEQAIVRLNELRDYYLNGFKFEKAAETITRQGELTARVAGLRKFGSFYRVDFLDSISWDGMRSMVIAGRPTDMAGNIERLLKQRFPQASVCTSALSRFDEEPTDSMIVHPLLPCHFDNIDDLRAHLLCPWQRVKAQSHDDNTMAWEHLTGGMWGFSKDSAMDDPYENLRPIVVDVSQLAPPSVQQYNKNQNVRNFFWKVTRSKKERKTTQSKHLTTTTEIFLYTTKEAFPHIRRYSAIDTDCSQTCILGPVESAILRMTDPITDLRKAYATHILRGEANLLEMQRLLNSYLMAAVGGGIGQLFDVFFTRSFVISHAEEISNLLKLKESIFSFLLIAEEVLNVLSQKAEGGTAQRMAEVFTEQLDIVKQTFMTHVENITDLIIN